MDNRPSGTEYVRDKRVGTRGWNGVQAEMMDAPEEPRQKAEFTGTILRRSWMRNN